jgi:hypothetical protein
MAHSKKDIKRICKGLAAQAGLDRAAYFATPGATAAGWRGGRAMVQTDRRKQASKNSCRQGRW